MTAQIIDGTAIAQKVRDEVKEKVVARIAVGNGCLTENSLRVNVFA